MPQISADNHPTQTNVTEDAYYLGPMQPRLYETTIAHYESIDEIKHTYLPVDPSLKTVTAADNSSRICAEGVYLLLVFISANNSSYFSITVCLI